MRPKPRSFSAITKTDRQTAISAIDAAVSSAGGWMMGHSLFSNISAAFRMSVPAQGYTVLGEKLADAGIRLDQASLETLAEIASDNDQELVAALNVTFIHNEPDLRHTIPAVPG